MDGFERRKEQKKEAILRAALELFAHYGFKKVSISNIAGKADVSPVTIYNHFGSKEKLVEQVVRKQVTDMLETYQSVIGGEGTFPEKLKKIVFDKIEIAQQFRGELARTLLKDNPAMQEFIESHLMQSAIRMTLDLFEQGRIQGFIGRDISDQTLVIYLEILRSGITASTRLYADEQAYPRLVKELNQLILYGLIDTGDRDEFHSDGK